MRYLINGWFGHDNLGDELLLHSALAAIRRRDPEAEFAVLTDDPSLTARYFGDRARAVSRAGRFLGRLRFAREALRADTYLIAGGTCLRDFATTGGTVRAVFQYCLLARLLGCRVHLVGVGAGPLWRPGSRRLVRWLAGRLAAVTVRDTDSLALLRSLGAASPRLAADLVYALPRPAGARAGAASPPRKAGFSLRAWDPGLNGAAGGASANPVGAAVSAFVRGSDFEEYVFFSLQEGKGGIDDDAAYIRSLDFGGKRVRVEHLSYADGLESVLARLGEVDFFVGMRLHALILASTLGKPLVGLAYDPKIRGLMKALGLEDFCVALEDVSGPRLAELAARCGTQGYTVEPLRAAAEAAFDALLPASGRGQGGGGSRDDGGAGRDAGGHVGDEQVEQAVGGRLGGGPAR